MRAPACLLLTLTVAAAAPQPTPSPPPSSSTTPTPPTAQIPLTSPFTNCIELDIAEIEELRSRLHNIIGFDLTGIKKNISFGLLEEDWDRLRLLEERLPVNSPLKLKLLKSFRILISAMYQAHATLPKVPQSNELNKTEFDPPNISKYSTKPTKVDQNLVLRDIKITTIIMDEIDNEAAESEQRESVLPFNTYENEEQHPNPTSVQLTTYNKQNILKEGTSTSSYSRNSHFTSKSNKESYKVFTNSDNAILQLPKEQPPNNNSVELDDIISDPTNTFKERQGITEDYKDLNINYENNQIAFSVEENNEAGINDEQAESKEVVFVEDYESTSEPITNVKIVSVIEDKSGKDAISGSEIPRVTTASKESTSKTNLGTDSSRFADIDGQPTDTNTNIDETAGISTKASAYTAKSTVHSLANDVTTKGGEIYYHDTEDPKSTSDQTFTSSLMSYTPEDENSIEDSKKYHTTPYNESKSSSGSEDIYSTVNYTVKTYHTQQSPETDLNRDSTTTLPSPRGDDISQGSDSSERPDHLTTFPTFNDYNITEIKIFYNSPSFVDVKSTTTEKSYIFDTSLNSTMLNTFHSTQGIDDSLSKTVNETFNLFTVVFPETPKRTSPSAKVNPLIIYPPDKGGSVTYPFGGPNRPPVLQGGCQNKHTCVRVQNIEFSNPKIPGRYTNQNSGINSEDIKFHSMTVSSRNNWDSDNMSWWNKIRTLRKKAVER